MAGDAPRPLTLPHTPHPTPYTLHPTPYTLQPAPFTRDPTPSLFLFLSLSLTHTQVNWKGEAEHSVGWLEMLHVLYTFFRRATVRVRIHFIIVMIRWTGLAPWELNHTR